MTKDENTTTYLLEMSDGTQKRITIPSTWNLTFGALIPGSQSNNGKIGLRVWHAKSQKAVFTDVVSFRDTSMQLEQRVTTTKHETYYKGNDEAAKAVVVESAAHEWINPDTPKLAQAAEVQQLKVVNLD